MEKHLLKIMNKKAMIDIDARIPLVLITILILYLVWKVFFP